MKLQIFDADYTMLNDMPLMRIFCKDERGKDFCVFYKNHLPYFYAHGDENKIKEKLKSFGGEIRNLEKVKKFLPVGYQKDKTEVFKITLRNPSKVPDVRDSLGCNVYEADILYKYRFFVDMGLRAMSWIEVKGNIVNTDTVSCAGIEADEITPVRDDRNVPLRIMAMDIETVAPSERIPVPEKDQITMISFAFSTDYKGKKDLVLLAKHAPLRTNQKKNTICTENEEKMLEKLKEILEDYDPDVITGYNLENFDMPFIIGRMDKLGINKCIGRVKDKNVYCAKFGPKSSTKMVGRAIADSYQIIKRDFSFKSYKLDNVSEKLLGKKKLDVSYKDFNRLWEDNGKGLQKLIDYSRKDSVLALELVEKKRLMDKYIALSRASGVLLKEVLGGGETIRIENVLLREFDKREILFPPKPTDKDVYNRMEERKKSGLKGGLVLEPDAGFHTDGYVVVLDFKSLYPSIIRTYNICPTTLVKGDPEVETMDCPLGTKFVKSDIKEGVLPHVLEKLINKRSEVKKFMYKENDPEKKSQLNAKQLALKILANSFYGYTGYLRAKTYVMDVANTITFFGRHLLERTRDEVTKMGYEVVYGDTDSVFVKVRSDNLETVASRAEKMVEKIKFPGVLILEFEKAFRSFLILTKKRYAGWAFEKTSGEWHDKIDMKGIETVRRDWPDIVTETMNVVLNTVLKEGDIKKAIRYVQGVVDQIETGSVDLRKLAVTKSITKSLENYDGKLPHIELAKKMKRRDPSQPPSPGTRISYVIVRGNQMLSMRAEDPEYIRENKLSIDSCYYIENQLIPPLERIFSVLGVDRGELMGKGRQCNLKNMLNPKSRNHTINIPPEKITVKSPEGFICRDCSKKFRRVPLVGKCECGGDIFAYASGNMGKTVLIV